MSKSLYMRAPKVLEEATRPNLGKQLLSLVSENEDISATDHALSISVTVRLKIVD